MLDECVKFMDPYRIALDTRSKTNTNEKVSRNILYSRFIDNLSMSARATINFSRLLRWILKLLLLFYHETRKKQKNTRRLRRITKRTSHSSIHWSLPQSRYTKHFTRVYRVCLCSRISFPMCVCIHTRIRFAIYVYEYVSRLIFGVSFASVMSKFFSFPRLISRIYTYHDLQMLLLRLENCA